MYHQLTLKLSDLFAEFNNVYIRILSIKTATISPNNTNRLAFVIEIESVFYRNGTEHLNII
jgi:hypothetical protein